MPVATFIHVVEVELMAAGAEIYGDLTEIFHDVFMRDDIRLSPELTAKGVQGWDSFKQIELIMACEEKWRIKFNTRELDELHCVGNLATMVEKKIG
jgi:acyl carrier protein